MHLGYGGAAGFGRNHLPRMKGGFGAGPRASAVTPHSEFQVDKDGEGREQ